MHRLFGKPGAKKDEPPPPTVTDASNSIGGRIKALEDKIKVLDKELLVYKTQLAKAKGPAKNTIQKKAMDCLKRKKAYEQQRDQLMGQQFNLDQTAFALESIKDTQTTVAAMKLASKELKKEHKKIDINKIEDLNDDLADMFEDMNEINESLGRSYGVPDYIDEADLEAELACLGDEFEEELGDANANPSYAESSALPYAPNNAIAAPGPKGIKQDAKVDEYGLHVQSL